MIRLLVNYNPLGFSPYWFLPGDESSTQNTNIMIIPMYGISCNKTHQPDLLVSCKRRTVTAKLGRSNTNAKIVVIAKGLPIILLMIAAITVKIKLNKANIQYSLRRARPLKFA